MTGDKLLSTLQGSRRENLRRIEERWDEDQAAAAVIAVPDKIYIPSSL
jgi:hypothetical protein